MAKMHRYKDVPNSKSSRPSGRATSPRVPSEGRTAASAGSARAQATKNLFLENRMV